MPDRSPRELPFRIGKYLCQEYLGGHMGEVYLAHDEKGDRQVVIKILRERDAQEPELRERFLAEGRMGCRCSHPNIITTHDTDDDGTRPYIVMEYLQGESLRSLMDRGGMDEPQQAIGIALQIARALKYLHAKGIVHRDIKPENVHVDGEGTAKLLDFGIARLQNSSLTQAGQVIGTPLYMAPEQVTGQPVSQAADVYAFGVLLFEMLTLASPYRAETREELNAAIVSQQPDFTPLEEYHVPRAIISLIEGCLRKKPEDRPSSFEAVCRELKPFASPELAAGTQHGVRPSDSPHSGFNWLRLALIAGGCLLLAGVLAYFVPKPHSAVLRTPSGDMVFVKGGPASLGRERKPVRVESFYIDKTEVPNKVFLEFCNQTGRPKPPGLGAPDLPVVNVTFEDAQAFARWAHKRLPTSFEWEKAARGTQGFLYPWGNTLRYDLAKVGRKGETPGPSPVNSYAAGASPCGALNMLGNVWEWVDARNAPKQHDLQVYRQMFSDLVPPLTDSEPFYEIRGGGYKFQGEDDDLPKLLYDSAPFPMRARKPDVGFRCVRTAPR